MTKTSSISQSLATAWTRFAIAARGSTSHPLDERRFWLFVLVARQQRHRLDRTLISKMCSVQAIDEKNIDRLSEMLEIADGLLNVVRGIRKVDGF